jgi:uncharacterized repeat protein (TIGR01451 family)
MKALSLSFKGDELPVASATQKTYRTRLLLRLTAILVLMGFLAGSLYLSTSVSANRSEREKRNRATSGKKISAPVRSTELNRAGAMLTKVGPVFTPQAAPPMITTYADDCTTPKTVFEVGETVCVQVSGIPVGGLFPRRLHWECPESTIVQATDIETDPQTGNLPITATFTTGGVTVDSRGLWHVAVKNPFFFYREATAEFTVVDPANATADLSVTSTFVSDSVQAGGQATFGLQVTNYGPDSSANIELTNAVPANTTFVSFQQLTGPTFTCTTPTAGGTGTTSCSITGLSANAVATFVGVYEVSSGTPADTTILNRADIAGLTASNPTGTNDLNVRNNFVESSSVVVSGAGGTCTLTCPTDVVVTADTTSGGNPGAFVTFAAASVDGSCGAITNSPASGSFFTVGTHTVTSSSEIGGASCFFTVTVLDTNPPTISCPANITVTAPVGATDYTLPMGPGTPMINASGGGTVTAVRSDDTPATFDDDGNVVTPAVVHAVTDPYPLGSTGIQWTVTDAGGRTASCTQTVTILSAGDRDPVTISCPANVNVTAPGGACEVTISATTIGTPSVNLPDNVTITPRRSDDRPLSDPFPAGLTTITWTATDDLNGNVASCVQNVSVIAGGGADNTPPVLVVPANVSVTTASCTALLDDELGVAQATDDGACNSSVTVVRSGVPAGNIFPTGTTTITYTAQDSAGNISTGTQLVTVTESPAIAPTITAPADVNVNTGPGATSCGTFVTEAQLGSAVANDNCAGVTVMRTGVPAGNIFPVGSTTVTYTATDRSGNTATDTQIVTVTDNTPPVVTAPAPVTLFTGPGASSCGVNVSNLDSTLGTGTATDNCPAVGAVIRSGTPSGNNFPVGETILTYTATDAHGNTASATQVVTVVDNTAPVISCPVPITLEPSCPTGAIATWTPPVGTDNCAGATTTETAGPAPGSVFPIGTTTVTYTVNDAHGNSASCSFTVTVLTPQVTIQNMMSVINGISGLTGTQRQGLLSKLQAALDAINDGKTNVACNKLADFNSQVQSFINNGTLTSAQGNSLLNSSNHVRNTIGCTNLPCS